MTDTDTDTDISYQTRQRILAAALPIAGFEGWTSKTLRAAVAECKLPKGSDALYFPGGAIELISFWGEESNRKAEIALTKIDLSALKIRKRVTAGVIARLETIGDNEEAARRALAKFSVPSSGAAGPKSLWAAADTIWRAIGDTSTDANFYSKRTVLSAVISSSLMAWLNDNSDDKAEARVFLDRRIENVMQFEKFKFKARTAREKWPDPIKAMAGLRYGARRRRRR